MLTDAQCRMLNAECRMPKRSFPTGQEAGDLTVAWSVVSKRGWKSRTTLWRAKGELIEAGFVYVTRKGQMPSICELLALTWFLLDVSKKFDHDALAAFKAKAYRVNTPLPTIKTKRDWTQPSGGRKFPEKRRPLSTSGAWQREARHRKLDHDVMIGKTLSQPAPHFALFGVGQYACAERPLLGSGIGLLG